METTSAKTPAVRLARVTPATLPAAHWVLARGPVTAAVLAAGPDSAEDAKGLVSRLCQLLAGHAGWDRRVAPDLSVPVLEPAIATHLARLQAAGKSGKTRENHRADLRRIARALAGTATPTRRADAEPAQVPAATGPLLTWLLAGEGPLTAVRAWEQLTGRRVTRAVLNPVAAAALSAIAAQPDPGTLAALTSVGTPAAGEVSPGTWPRSATDKPTPPLSAELPRLLSAFSRGPQRSGACSESPALQSGADAIKALPERGQGCGPGTVATTQCNKPRSLHCVFLSAHPDTTHDRQVGVRRRGGADITIDRMTGPRGAVILSIGTREF